MSGSTAESSSLLDDDGGAPAPGDPGGGDPAPGDKDKSGEPTPELDLALPEDIKDFVVPFEAKPDYLPEDLWDDEKKAVRVGSALKRLSDTQRALRAKTPEGPEKYEFNDEELGIDENAPGTKALFEVAKKRGITQEEMDQIFAGFKEDAKALEFDPEKEKQQLLDAYGEKLPAIKQATKNFVQSTFKENTPTRELAMMLAESAVGVQLLHEAAVAGRDRQIVVNDDAPKGDDIPSLEELLTMQKDPRYDPDSTKYDVTFHKKVSALYKKRRERGAK